MKWIRKSIGLMSVDIVCVYLSVYMAFFLKLEGKVPWGHFIDYWDQIGIICLIKLAVYHKFNLYKNVWEYASIEEAIHVILAPVIANIMSASYIIIFHPFAVINVFIFALIGTLDILFLGLSRYAYRVFRVLSHLDFGMTKKETRVLIVGAGDAGASVIRELKNVKGLKYKPIVLIDDDIKKKGQRIHGIPIVGQRRDIACVVQKYRIDEIIIAIPSARKRDIRGIIDECRKTRCKLKLLPGLSELIEGKVTIKEIRDVQIEDLLGRDEVHLDTEAIRKYIFGNKVLVTGGGGSIGSELCRQIIRYGPQDLCILDIYENNAFDLLNELERRYGEVKAKIVIGSVRDRDRIEELIERERPDIIFHAAAHKHVTLMEQNPKEAVKNNVLGTLNLIRAADQYGVKKFVFISTDKAVNPASVMGATKRLCEILIQAINPLSSCDFLAVRFGNVLASNGSVVPLFKKQIQDGGPVTVTHREVTRYFMTIPEAAQLVMQAGALARGGEIFILDMGEPVRILKLAEDLIRLSGFEPYADIDIKITGLRPGEKLCEELNLEQEQLEATEHEKIHKCGYVHVDYGSWVQEVEQLIDSLSTESDEEVKEHLGCLLYTYKPTEL